MTSVGSIVGGAFRLVRQHPLSVLVWGLIYMAALAGLMFAMRPVFQLYADLFSQQLAAGAGKPLPPEVLQPYVARMQAAGGVVFLAEIGIFAVLMVLFTATQRAVLRPAESSFFYLRLGGDELRLIGLGLVLTVCLSIALGMAMLVLMIFFGILFAITMAATGSPVIGILLFAVAYVVMMAAMIYAEVRLSLAFPLTFMRRSFVVGEAWRLTRGRFWTLFGAYFLIGLLYMVLAAIFLAIIAAPFFSEVGQGPNSPETIQLAMQHQLDLIWSVNVTSVTLWLGGTLLCGLTMALFGGAVATAARDLSPDTQAVMT